MASHYFFDVPVYRLAEDTYYKQMDDFIDQTLFPPNMPYSAARREREQQNPNENTWMRDHLHQQFGGAWRYNEVIGYIRLHFLGSQIRGEYYGVQVKRITRTRKKILEFRTWKLAPEIDIPQEASSADIYRLVLEYLDDCRKELKGRIVDSKLLEAIGPYVDWKSLWQSGWGRDKATL